MPDEAVEIAKTHRKAKRLWGGMPPASLNDDGYMVEAATERDFARCRKCGVVKLLTS